MRKVVARRAKRIRGYVRSRVFIRGVTTRNDAMQFAYYTINCDKDDIDKRYISRYRLYRRAENRVSDEYRASACQVHTETRK